MKKTSKHIYLIAFSLLLFSCGLFAQKFTANASKTKVAVGEQFQISYSLNTSGSGFKTPDLSAFDVYSGPNQSSSMQFINGNVSQSLTFSFIIAARKEGKFTIPPASIVAGGNRVESNSLVIEVVKGGASQSGSAQANTHSGSQGAGDNLFAKISVNKTKAYLGEQITVSHKIYTRLNIRGFQDIQFPSYNGFWSQDLQQKNQIELTTENIDGINYYVAEIKKSFIFPQRSGTLEISPIEVECVVRERTNSGPQSIFDQFFGNGGYRDVVYKAKSKPVKIEVMPLPEDGKPEGFNGAVGNYSFNARLSKEKVKANEAVNISINISGQGNLKLIEAPKLNFPDEFEIYDPKTTENIGTTNNGISGNKNFDYLVIPRHPGEYKINDFSFSFFDPQKKTYITLPSPEFIIKVEEGEKEDAPSVVAGNQTAKEEVKIIGDDIRYIKTGKINFIKKDEYFFGSALFYTGLSAPFILLASFLLIRRKYIKQQSDIVGMKSKKAGKVAQKRLAIAATHMKTNSKELFYAELLKALYGYFTDKFNMPGSELSKEAILTALQNKNASGELINELSHTIEVCEAARYAPSLAENDLTKIYDKASHIITQTENQLS